MTTMTEPTTATIEAPGAVLTYDIRRSDSTSEPALFLLGSPMGAAKCGPACRIRWPRVRSLPKPPD